MRAIVVTETGGPEVMVLAEHPDPEPGPGQVVVEAAAAGVNFIDIYRRSGVVQAAAAVRARAARARAPSSPSGRASPSSPWATGWRGHDGPGSYAERVVVDAGEAVPVPDGIDLNAAAAVMLQGMTAHYLCRSTFPVSRGDGRGRARGRGRRRAAAHPDDQGRSAAP